MPHQRAYSSKIRAVFQSAPMFPSDSEDLDSLSQAHFITFQGQCATSHFKEIHRRKKKKKTLLQIQEVLFLKCPSTYYEAIDHLL